MEQLTQNEFINLNELIHTEALAIRKCGWYERQCESEGMKRWFQEAAEIHRSHLQGLMEQLRHHSGRKKNDSKIKH
ncbi:hypothetical protein [Melghirimyces algeriensis]|uniref:Coat F domain-containing protein n=1 Tax=Melghirimyces algeriensis TaxID=910412 RepID=A0A521CJY8_9BACL|nr:hypothetical protein [Melghirimyces algeriensis]SMO59757.1 hypothetical protein SAMN06264849_10437 [Melghirimyces algeriensis]